MEISDKSIKYLAKAICGDYPYMPYKTGQQLVSFFADFGANDVYDEGFPSRCRYTEGCIRLFNNSPELKKILEAAVDPREFYDSNKDCAQAVEEINKFLILDGYVLKLLGNFYKITSLKGILVEPETVKGIDLSFLQEQIEKCKYKIEHSDFNGAITNARSLAEAVMIAIIEMHEIKEFKSDGNLENLYKRVKKILNLSVDPETYPLTVIQILSGLDSITSGLAGLSNGSGDRHANKFNTRKHHAKLAFNAAITLVDFLVESLEYQKEKKHSMITE